MEQESETSKTNQKNLIVTATGYDPKTKDVFKQYITKLGAQYIDHIRLDTNILISADVLSEKYRVISKWLL